MEGTLTFPHGGRELLLQDGDIRVVGHLEVVDARHDAGKVVVWRVRSLARPADDSEHRREILESCNKVSFAHYQPRTGLLTSNR